jgi:hypothetical protein
MVTGVSSPALVKEVSIHTDMPISAQFMVITGRATFCDWPRMSCSAISSILTAIIRPSSR